LAGINTGTVPPFCFNLAGITVWNYHWLVLQERRILLVQMQAYLVKCIFLELVPTSIVISNLLKSIAYLLPLCISIISRCRRLNASSVFYFLFNCSNGVLGLGLGMIISLW
jgi:lipopolysaccharide transport system permease protein